MPPAPPLPPAAPDLGPAPHIDADSLFLPSTTVAHDAPANAGAHTAFGIDDSPWDANGRPTLRVRDLLADPDEAPRRDEVSFFAPVTPEQLGEDPHPPAP